MMQPTSQQTVAYIRTFIAMSNMNHCDMEQTDFLSVAYTMCAGSLWNWLLGDQQVNNMPVILRTVLAVSSTGRFPALNSNTSLVFFWQPKAVNCLTYLADLMHNMHDEQSFTRYCDFIVIHSIFTYEDHWRSCYTGFSPAIFVQFNPITEYN